MLTVLTGWMIAMALFCYVLCAGSRKREDAEMRALGERASVPSSQVVRRIDLSDARGRPGLDHARETRRLVLNG